MKRSLRLLLRISCLSGLWLSSCAALTLVRKQDHDVTSSSPLSYEAAINGLPGASRRSILLATASASLLPPVPSLAEESSAPKKLIFQTLPSGVMVADILVGTSPETAQANSKVNIHILGRLLGKQGWSFMNTQASGEDPFRLELGTHTVVPGLEEGLIGMEVGGRRRIVVPSSVGYLTKDLQPIPRDFGNRQRLYTTVMNNVRIEREREGLGQDLAGVVVFDIDLIRIRT